MSDNPTGAHEITAPDLAALVRNAVKDELAPLSKSTGDIQGMLTEAARQTGADPVELEKGLGKYPLGRKTRALALAMLEGKSGPVRADDIPFVEACIRKHWRLTEADSTVKWLGHVKTVLQSGVAATAGDMVFPQYDPEWIDLLRPMTTVRQFARTIPMPRGATSRRKQTGAATAYYTGEGVGVTPSNLTVGRANLSYKKLVAETVVSNDLLRFGGTESDAKIQDDLLRVVALREDRAFLLGNPPVDAGSPQGIRYQTLAANVFAAGGTALSNYQADLTKAIRLVEESDVDMTNARWVMSPGQYWAIYALATTVGDWIFAQGLQGGNLFGFPVMRTSQLKESRLATWGYGTSGTAGMIFFVAPQAMEIHDSLQRTVEVFRGGAYTSGSSIVSGAETDETVIVCQAEHDFLQTYDTAAAIITGYAS